MSNSSSNNRNSSNSNSNDSNTSNGNSSNNSSTNSSNNDTQHVYCEYDMWIYNTLYIYILILIMNYIHSYWYI